MTDVAYDRIPILTLTLGGEQYALKIDYVVEVAAMVEYSTVADADPSLLGLINRHGQVMPLIDLRVVFQCDAPPIDPNVLFVVSQFEDKLVGLVVDTVNQVEYVKQGDLKSAPGGGRWIEQVVSYKDDLIQLISLPAIVKKLLAETNTTQEVEGT